MRWKWNSHCWALNGLPPPSCPKGGELAFQIGSFWPKTCIGKKVVHACLGASGQNAPNLLFLSLFCKTWGESELTKHKRFDGTVRDRAGFNQLFTCFRPFSYWEKKNINKTTRNARTILGMFVYVLVLFSVLFRSPCRRGAREGGLNL